MQPWGRDQFVSVMDEIYAKRVGKIGDIRVSGDWQHQSTRKYFHFYFDRSIDGRRQSQAWIAFPIFRDTDDWHPSLANLPMMMNNLDKTSDKEHLKYLLDACRHAHIVSIIRLEDRLELSMDKLALFLEGKLSQDHLYGYWSPRT